MPIKESNLGVSAMIPHEEYFFRDGTIFFLVENKMFRLHRMFFERESDVFRAKLGPSASDGEGCSPDCPFKIEDVTSDEFAQFVWVWYNPRYSFANQGKERWLTILRLATKWRFHEIRQLAIRHLEEVKFEPVEKIATYRNYSVGNELLLPSYVSLCTSPTLPSPEEGRRLTLETVLTLACAREQILLRASGLGCKTPTVASAPEDIVKAVVGELFDLTPHPNDPSVRAEGQVNNGKASGGNSEVPEVVTVKQPNPSKKGKPNGVPTSSELPLPGSPATVNGAGSRGKYGK